MASPGTYISGAGHTALLVWLIAGWGLSSEPLEFDVTEVSVVTGEEFAALVAGAVPVPVVDAPLAPVLPDVEDAPETPQPDVPPEVAQPPVPEEPVAETPPPDAPEPPAPVAQVEDVAPTPPAPPETLEVPDLTLSDTPVPEQADRVAPEPVAAPEPDVTIADEVTETATPDSVEPAEVVEEAVEATAPEEATTEIITEAEEPSSAVTTSLRPSARPNRPEPEPEPEPESEPEPEEPADPSTADVLEETDADVQAAVVAALDSMRLPGPPLTGDELGALYRAISGKWIVDNGSEAARITIVVSFSLTPERRLDGDVSLVSATNGPPAAQEAAFQAARRAIFNAARQNGGLPLPDDKYDTWRDIEITFDPSEMRLR